MKSLFVPCIGKLTEENVDVIVTYCPGTMVKVMGGMRIDPNGKILFYI